MLGKAGQGNETMARCRGSGGGLAAGAPEVAGVLGEGAPDAESPSAWLRRAIWSL